MTELFKRDFLVTTILSAVVGAFVGLLFATQFILPEVNQDATQEENK